MGGGGGKDTERRETEGIRRSEQVQILLALREQSAMFILLNWCQVSAICYCVICYCLFALMERECVWTLRDIANKALFSESEDNIESFGNFSITLSLKVVTHKCPYMRVSACSSSVLFLSCILSDGPTLLDCTRRVIYCKLFNSFSANVTKTIVLWRPGTRKAFFVSLSLRGFLMQASGETDCDICCAY